MTARSFFFASAITLLFSNLLFAQTPPEEANTSSSEQTIEARIRHQVTMNTLSGGTGGFFVPNSRPETELDEEKAYLETGYAPAEIQLLTGARETLPARLRLIDAAFEVQVDGQAFELDGGLVHQVRIDERLFEYRSDLTDPRAGRRIYEVHYAGTDRQLLELHTAVWQDPPPNNTYFGAPLKRTLRRENQLLLLAEGRIVEVKKARDVLDALSIPKRGEVADFIQENRLDLREAAGIATLLRHLQ